MASSIDGWRATYHAPPVPGARARLFAAVRDGLARRQRELPTRLLADRGAVPLRRRLDALAARRLERLEHPLIPVALAAPADAPGIRTVVDIEGHGGPSTLAVLDALDPLGERGVDWYVAVDPSLDAARDAVDLVRARHPTLGTSLVVADARLALPVAPPDADVARAPRLLLLLGDTLASHEPIGALRLLRTVRAAMAAKDVLLLGIDQRVEGRWLAAALREDPPSRAAYHRHALAVLRRDLAADVDPSAFAYDARVDVEAQRIDLLLVATRPTRIALPGTASVELARGDTLRTGVHSAFDRARLGAMLADVGLAIDAWHERGGGERALVRARASA